MNLYQIQIPVLANDGKRHELARRMRFESWLLQYAGGYSKGATLHGAWHDISGTYKEEMIPYQVATDALSFEKIISAALDIFPDQHAIFTAQIGQADIRYRAPALQAAE